ncbi:MAG: hypothetical protein MJA83_05540 [Gammaproteobacteria bacterium]|nr:hypothetical protein [Gammaproteobacteria bacterium]
MDSDEVLYKDALVCSDQWSAHVAMMMEILKVLIAHANGKPIPYKELRRLIRGVTRLSIGTPHLIPDWLKEEPTKETK